MVFGRYSTLSHESYLGFEGISALVVTGIEVRRVRCFHDRCYPFRVGGSVMKIKESVLCAARVGR